MEVDVRTAGRILVCLRYGIGDVVMQLPALEALRAAVPRAQITALGARPAVELLDEDPRLDRVACVQEMGFAHLGDPGMEADRARFAGWLRREGFDLIIDPSHAVVCLQALLRDTGAPVLDITPEIQNAALAASENGVAALNLAAGRAWGIRPEGRPAIVLNEEDRVWADEFVRRHGLAGADLLGLSGAASSPLKQWPLVRLAAAADATAARFGLRLMAFDTTGEPATTELVPHLQHPVTRACGLHLKALAALLERCRLLLCNDTGLMHLAAACRVRVVAVFGPTCERIYLPPPPEAAAAPSGIDCRHRRTDSFGPPECIRADRCLIRPESCITAVSIPEVMRRVQRALAP